MRLTCPINRPKMPEPNRLSAGRQEPCAHHAPKQACMQSTMIFLYVWLVNDHHLARIRSRTAAPTRSACEVTSGVLHNLPERGMRGRGRDGIHMHNQVRGTCGMVGERVVQRRQRTHEVVQVTGDVGSCRLNLREMYSAHARFPAENKTHPQAWHHVMTILHQC